MTDVTGFGLLGHLCEMCSVNSLMAKVYFEKVPRLPNLDYYIKRGCMTGGGRRNWESYGRKVEIRDEFARIVLSDPQTNGGLLVAVDPAEVGDFETLITDLNLNDSVCLIGQFEKRTTERRQVFVA